MITLEDGRVLRNAKEQVDYLTKKLNIYKQSIKELTEHIDLINSILEIYEGDK